MGLSPLSSTDVLSVNDELGRRKMGTLAQVNEHWRHNHPMASFLGWASTRTPVLWVRVHFNEIWRRPLPDSFTPAIVKARSWVGRRRRGRRQYARESMQFMLGEGVSEGELDRLADAFNLYTTWRAESRIQHHLLTHQEVVGLEHLQAAVAEGKGCLLSFTHHGDYLGGSSSVARKGFPVVVFALSSLWDRHGLLWQHQQLRAISSVPEAEVVDVALGSAGIRDRLENGQTVSVAIDVPGHTPARMFGRDLMLSSGGIRIAAQLDVPVIAMTSQRVGSSLVGGARVHLAPALYPRDFSSPEELHAELIRHFEAAILEWPEATEKPMRMAAKPTQPIEPAAGQQSVSDAI